MLTEGEVKKFKKVYRMRSEIFHGNQRVSRDVLAEASAEALEIATQLTLRSA